MTINTGYKFVHSSLAITHPIVGAHDDQDVHDDHDDVPADVEVEPEGHVEADDGSHESEPYIPIKPYRCLGKCTLALYSLYSHFQALVSPINPSFLAKESSHEQYLHHFHEDF